ncbi:MAG: hypothetical protein IT343_03635 [Candidatus Melainabacteria bacterium]|nr:hypothetical protein [Candidatus Melainabacteria bacterium]
MATKANTQTGSIVLPLEDVVNAFSPYKTGKQNAFSCTSDALQRAATALGSDGDLHIECLLSTLEFFMRNGAALPSNFDTLLFISEINSLTSVHYRGRKEKAVRTYLRAAAALRAYNVARGAERELLNSADAETVWDSGNAGAALREEVLEAMVRFNIRNQSFEEHLVIKLINVKREKKQDTHTRLEIAELKIIIGNEDLVREAHEDLTKTLPKLSSYKQFCLASELLGRACSIQGRHHDAVTWFSSAQVGRQSDSSELAQALMNKGDHEAAARIYRELYRKEVMRRSESTR